MMKKISIILLFMFGLAGCGSYTQTLQVDDKAYLLLMGGKFHSEKGGEAYRDKILVIDDGIAYDILSEFKRFNLNDRDAIKIKLEAGRHNIKIIEDERIVVDRDFYVSTGNSFEIEL